MKLTPEVVSPSYLRDHQYDKGVKVICEDYEPELFDKLLWEFGEENLSEFPSGKKVFFCKKVFVNVGTVGHVDYGLKADPIEMIICGEPIPSKHKHPWWNKNRW